MKDLMPRIIGALIYIIALLGGLYLRQPYWLFICTILLVVAMYEWSRMEASIDKNKITFITGLTLLIFLQFALFLTKFAYGAVWNNLAILMGIAYYAFCSLVFRKGFFERKYVPGMFIYILIPFVFLYLLGLAIPPTFLLMLFCIIWINDTFAYLGGKMYGRTKLAPRISPGKTWEGTIGGTIVSMAGAIIIAIYFKDISIGHWLVLGVIITTCASLGDLVESMFKRSLDVKDSGNFLPGHGGALGLGEHRGLPPGSDQVEPGCGLAGCSTRFPKRSCAVSCRG